MKIILIGFMGSGKTTVAKILADKLSCRLIETDAEILKEENEASIADIFKKHGEQYFRELESKAAEKLKDLENCVISPGGGMIVNKINLDNLKQGKSLIIYLETSFEILKSRILNSSNTEERPLFKDIHSVKKLYENRLEEYSSAANIKINTDSLSPNEVADKILKKMTIEN